MPTLALLRSRGGLRPGPAMLRDPFRASLLLALAWALSPVYAQEPKAGKPKDVEFATGEKLPAPPGGPVVPRSYAVVIGISEYPNLPADNQLKYGASDARYMYNSLISPEAGRFPAENVHLILNGDANLARLRYEFEKWLPGIATPEDRIEIYFNGHGFLSNGKGYLAPSDIDPKRVETTGYPMAQLGKVLGSDIRAKWKVLFTDTCHSGAILPTVDTTLFQRDLLQSDSKILSLAASAAGEQAWEYSKWGGGHGAFTYCLKQALDGEADTNGDGVVTAAELVTYVRAEVSALVARDTPGKQTPTLGGNNFDPNMILAFNPLRIRPRSSPAPGLGTLIFESNMDNVNVYVDNILKGQTNRSSPLKLTGIMPGNRIVEGVRHGYVHDGPREVIVVPGENTTVTFRIEIRTRPKQAAAKEFEEGMIDYQKGFDKNYETAARHFQKALSTDGQYQEAALYLGRARHALRSYRDGAAAFEQALKIDRDYAEAHASYAAMLLDRGALDQAIIHLTTGIQLDAKDPLTNSLTAQAFMRKGALDEAIRYARESIRLAPEYPEAHFWLAESLRIAKQCPEGIREYQTYLKLSNVGSKLKGDLNYYALGYLIGLGRRRRAAQTDIWRELQVLANFGVCDCHRMAEEFDPAIASCKRALALDDADQVSHYALGEAYLQKWNVSNDASLLALATRHFETTIRLNKDTEEAENARKYLKKIEQEKGAQRPGSSGRK